MIKIQFITLAVAAMLVPMSFGQSKLYTFDGISTGDDFGVASCGAGDVNNDGFDDLVVGSSGADLNGVDSGSVWVFSGVDGSTLYRHDGNSGGDSFGGSVDGAGDVNSDGFADVIVGATGSDFNGDKAGSAYVFSGIDGSVLYTFHGDSAKDGFGSVAGPGDMNGDGFADLVVGARSDDNNGQSSGIVRAFSGIDGSILYTIDGATPDAEFGNSVSGAGDVNGDGFADFIVGSPYDDSIGSDYGSARVFSGVNGSLLHTFNGDGPGDIFGITVGGGGDFNGDGLDDVIVGAIFDNNKGNDSGSARVFSGVNGSVLYTLNGDSANTLFGDSVASAGDVNGDGFDDPIVGATGSGLNGTDPGYARVFSGVDGSTLYTIEGPVGEKFGFSAHGVGDVNGDGLPDLIVGNPKESDNEIGSAHVYSGCGDIGTTYCSPAVANSSGLPAELNACGSDVAIENRLVLSATHLPVNKFGYFLNSQVQSFVPLPPGSQGNLCLGGAIGRHVKQIASSGPGGALALTLDLTSLPRPNGTHSVVAGETWNFQAWFRDKNPGLTSNFTDALEIQFQ